LQFVVLKPFSWRDAFAFPEVNCNAASCFARDGVAKEICSGYWQRNLAPQRKALACFARAEGSQAKGWC
jgi:hypothetical protein